MKGKALTGGGLGIDLFSMSQGVSRGHSSLQKRAAFKHCGGLTSGRRAERYAVDNTEGRFYQPPVKATWEM